MVRRASTTLNEHKKWWRRLSFTENNRVRKITPEPRGRSVRFGFDPKSSAFLTPNEEACAEKVKRGPLESPTGDIKYNRNTMSRRKVTTCHYNSLDPIQETIRSDAEKEESRAKEDENTVLPTNAPFHCGSLCYWLGTTV